MPPRLPLQDASCTRSSAVVLTNPAAALPLSPAMRTGASCMDELTRIQLLVVCVLSIMVPAY